MIRKILPVILASVFFFALSAGTYAGEAEPVDKPPVEKPPVEKPPAEKTPKAAPEEKPSVEKAPEKEPAAGKKPAAKPALEDEEPEEDAPPYDKVILKSGEVVKGYVRDTGGSEIHVHRALGALIIRKKDIERIEPGKGQPDQSSNLDLVYTTDGKVIPGRAREDKDTGKVYIIRRTASGKGEIVLPLSEVLRIHYADKAKNKALAKKTDPAEAKDNPQVTLFINALLEDLASDNADRVAAADKALSSDMLLFAEPQIAKALETAFGAFRTRLLKLDKLARLKRAVAPNIVTEFPRVYDCLMNVEFEPKLETLQLVLILYPEDAPAILVETALDNNSEDMRIRRYCIKQLNELGRPQELIKILEEAEPQLAMAAAIHLGERGILVGLPILIEALDSEHEEIRALILNKLREFTGQDFGGTPYDPPDTRKQWIKKWKKWMDENKARISRQAAIVRNEDIPEEDRKRSDFLYRQGQISYEAGNVSEALYLFEEALRYNPTNVAAHVNIAVTMYQEMKDMVGARERLIKLQNFYPDSLSSSNTRDIFFHLGMIALANSSWDKAQQRFIQATTQDGQFIKGFLALAKSYQAQLEHDEKLVPGPNADEEAMAFYKANREQILKDSRDAYQDAEKLIAGTRSALEDEDYVAGWREAVSDLEKEKTNNPHRPDRMSNPVPKDLVELQRKLLKRRHAEVLYEIARTHHALDNAREALRTIEKACKLMPNDTGLLFHAAMLYEIDGNVRDAARTYNRILKIDPSHADAQRNLEQLKKDNPGLEEGE
ncbi:MAG: tetratricopeptide repeat protein [Planctomycetota bacterium]|jgi:tetratricopeptide (TPR) repeat protein